MTVRRHNIRPAPAPIGMPLLMTMGTFSLTVRKPCCGTLTAGTTSLLKMRTNINNNKYKKLANGSVVPKSLVSPDGGNTSSATMTSQVDTKAVKITRFDYYCPIRKVNETETSSNAVSHQPPPLVVGTLFASQNDDLFTNGGPGFYFNDAALMSLGDHSKGRRRGVNSDDVVDSNGGGYLQHYRDCLERYMHLDAGDAIACHCLLEHPEARIISSFGVSNEDVWRCLASAKTSAKSTAAAAAVSKNAENFSFGLSSANTTRNASSVEQSTRGGDSGRIHHEHNENRNYIYFSRPRTYWGDVGARCFADGPFPVAFHRQYRHPHSLFTLRILFELRQSQGEPVMWEDIHALFS